jgi:prolyl oligopeptidase
LTKQHTIDDFIAGGEYLIEHKYTSPAHLAGEGTSAGGITIGGAITQRPEMFGAALIRVGDSDSLRSETMASGPANIPEFGTVTEADGFKALLAMDAYQHVKANTPANHRRERSARCTLASRKNGRAPASRYQQRQTHPAAR